MHHDFLLERVVVYCFCRQESVIGQPGLPQEEGGSISLRPFLVVTIRSKVCMKASAAIFPVIFGEETLGVSARVRMRSGGGHVLSLHRASNSSVAVRIS